MVGYKTPHSLFPHIIVTIDDWKTKQDRIIQRFPAFFLGVSYFLGVSLARVFRRTAGLMCIGAIGGLSCLGEKFGWWIHHMSHMKRPWLFLLGYIGDYILSSYVGNVPSLKLTYCWWKKSYHPKMDGPGRRSLPFGKSSGCQVRTVSFREGNYMILTHHMSAPCIWKLLWHVMSDWVAWLPWFQKASYYCI